MIYLKFTLNWSLDVYLLNLATVVSGTVSLYNSKKILNGLFGDNYSKYYNIERFLSLYVLSKATSDLLVALFLVLVQ